MNPILWLELRTRLRERKLWILALLFLLLFAGIDFATIFGGSWQDPESRPPADIGGVLHGANTAALMGLALVLGWAIGSGRLPQEREQRTLSGLLNTPLSGWEIVAGKLMGSWALLLWFFSLTLPFFAFSFLWGGRPWGNALAGFGVCLLTGLTVTAISVGLSGFFRRTATSYIAIGLLLLIWLLLLPILGGICQIPLQGKSHETARTVVETLFFSHNPVVVLVSVMWEPDGDYTKSSLIFCEGLGVWIGLSALSLWIGVRGLRRGFAEKL